MATLNNVKVKDVRITTVHATRATIRHRHRKSLAVQPNKHQQAMAKHVVTTTEIATATDAIAEVVKAEATQAEVTQVEALIVIRNLDATALCNRIKLDGDESCRMYITM